MELPELTSPSRFHALEIDIETFSAIRNETFSEDMRVVEEPSATVGLNTKSKMRRKILRASSFQRKSTPSGPLLKKVKVDHDCGIWYVWVIVHRKEAYAYSHDTVLSLR